MAKMLFWTSVVASYSRAAEAMATASPAGALSCEGKQEPLFIMGYGSLMNSESRKGTKCSINPMDSNLLFALLGAFELKNDTQQCVTEAEKRDNELIPVKISGIRRGWYFLPSVTVPANFSVFGKQSVMTFPTRLGAVEDSNAEMYAVIYPVDQAELDETDKHQVQYQKLFLDKSKVTLLNASMVLPECAKIRWYAQEAEKVKLPTREFPLVQSYIDVFLLGAMELEKNLGQNQFMSRVIKSTFGWSKHWVNDRSLAYRPWKSVGYGSYSEVLAINYGLMAAPVVATLPSSAGGLPEAALMPLTQDMVQAIQLPGVFHARAETAQHVANLEQRIAELASAATQRIAELESASTQRMAELESATTQRMAELESASTQRMAELESANTLTMALSIAVAVLSSLTVVLWQFCRALPLQGAASAMKRGKGAGRGLELQ